MDPEDELHYADDSADDPYDVILLPETSTRRSAPDRNRLSPAHASPLSLKGEDFLCACAHLLEVESHDIVLGNKRRHSSSCILHLTFI
ncbi:hypothetical protein JTE90_023516 [Oedothorax gibbosus]|uniref:Uncharacterized protein n=1 Tax=Oedothorax gibbosus TaxID=931172 RepID=A0AAV6VSK6_9ARAC|nr:hypothetical protein JTE90_023516 [Oedothorax gibbosus]